MSLFHENIFLLAGLVTGTLSLKNAIFKMGGTLLFLDIFGALQ